MTARTRPRGPIWLATAMSLFAAPATASAVAAHQRAVADLGHLFARHHRLLDERGGREVRDVVELALGRPRAQRGHRDAAALELDGERLGEREHVRLARVVRGHARPRLKRRRGRDLQDLPAAARAHRLDVQARELRERDDVERDHLAQLRERLLDELPVHAEARVVDEDSTASPSASVRANNASAAPLADEIERDDVHAHAVALLERAFCSSRTSARRATRTRSWLVRGEQRQHRFADAARRARDQRGGHRRRSPHDLKHAVRRDEPAAHDERVARVREHQLTCPVRPM